MTHATLPQIAALEGKIAETHLVLDEIFELSAAVRKTLDALDPRLIEAAAPGAAKRLRDLRWRARRLPKE